ncbi:MAG: methyl-accepting chemotaxis protein [Gammaproteobacteria bacterium]
MAATSKRKSTANSSRKKTSGTAKRKPSTRKAASTKQNQDSGLNVELLEQTFNALAPYGESLVARFYDELFNRYPQVRPLFRNTTQQEQQRKLLAALKLVINNLRNPAVLTQTLQDLGRRHQSYGAVPGHYQAVASTLLDVMQEFAGSLWTPKVHKAWNDALQTVAEIMLNAYDNTVDQMPTNSLAMDNDAQNSNDELTKLRSAVDGALTAIMMVDRNLTITYVNRSTMELLQKNEDILRSLYPGFSSDRIVGTNIDMFHKNPAHQRQLLSNPANLPYSTDIHVGPLTFRINVTAQRDAMGNYIGNTLEWSDVTELRRKETEVSRLQGTIDGAMTAFMMVNRNLEITYVNESTRKLLRQHEQVLRDLYAGFTADGIVGTNIDIFHKNPAHQRRILENPANLPYSTDIQVGPLMFNINVTAIKDREGEFVGCALEWSDVTELRKKETEVARLQSAIDGANANFMLCDGDLNITYVNPSVVNMLSRRQSELRKIWPNLDTNNLVGQNIDQFHKNPAHQRALLMDVSRLPYKAEIEMGDLEFEVNATAILDHNGNYMGNMVQWTDITEQKDAERQIQNLVQKAIEGKLDERLDTSEYAGFMSGLGKGINTLLDTVVTPLKEITSTMSSLANGDLTNTMDGNYQGDFGAMVGAVNATLNNLVDVVSRIRQSSGNIASASSEIAQGNADLSQRTEEQASSLEETASSMEELTSTVKQNADNARQANQLAAGARDEAEKGGEVVGNAVSAMSEINEASNKIADIISVIDEIAFQTNLLALNAAVEAARAGEQGRGFAVVATEVRNLAQRSAGAAKEIKALINDSVKKVEDGSRLVDQSGKTLVEIVSSVKKVSDIVAEIAAASQEQSAGIEQVNKAVVQMDEVTQQNGALVEEAAAASASLDEQAKALDNLVSFFKVGENAERSIQAQLQQSQDRARHLHSKAANRFRTTRPEHGEQHQTSGKVSDDGSWEEF